MKLSSIKLNNIPVTKSSKKFNVIDYGGKRSRRKIGDIRSHYKRVIIK